MRPFTLLTVLLLACGGDDAKTTDAGIDAGSGRGRVQLSWQITFGDETLSCEDVSASLVSISFVPINGITGIADSLSCASTTATTQEIIPGEYHMELQLKSTEGVALLAEPLVQDVTVEAGKTTSAPIITFNVKPAGSFTFSVAGANGDVCQAEPAAAEYRFELQNADNECVAGVSLEFAGQTVETSCGELPGVACPRGDLLGQSSLRSGSYTLYVVGTTADDVDCYVGQTRVNVPGNDLSVDADEITLNLTQACAETDAGI